MAGRETIIVGISGGVDSSVAALCLLRDGYDVQGLHMTNWTDEDGYCQAADDFQAARAVCTQLAIPLHRVDFSRQYREEVFSRFLEGYAAGRTPNPDVLCNRQIKFGVFLDHARRLGAKRIATGHYARLDHGTNVRLLMAADHEKDQTYFLHAVPAEALAHTLFPLGEFNKAEVRALANDAGLPNHDRPDSTGICFVGERPFRGFLGRHLPQNPGPVLAVDGSEIGRHSGLAFYTLGQRAGLGLGGMGGSASKPWYVAGKDPQRNALIVVQGRTHPVLHARQIDTEMPVWIGNSPAALHTGEGLRCRARIRHRHTPAECHVHARRNGSLSVFFAAAQWAPTPGQYVVFYAEEMCLGGAVISKTHHTQG
jgi:tRNA-specific 2-thiouridylase